MNEEKKELFKKTKEMFRCSIMPPKGTWILMLNLIDSPNESISKGVKKTIDFLEDHYFGHCPFPDHENYYANFEGDTWYYCPKCRIKWYIGDSIFSLEHNKATWRKIKDYKTIGGGRKTPREPKEIVINYSEELKKEKGKGNE